MSRLAKLLSVLLVLAAIIVLSVILAVRWLDQRDLGDSGPQEKTAQPKPGTTARNDHQTFPDLSKILEADSILIVDEWVGLSPVAPIQAHYPLKKLTDAFSGEAQFSAGYGENAKSTHTEIKIPIKTVHEFLKKLEQTELEEGPYKPRIDHTDDYPKITIELNSKDEKIVFWSGSQGAGHVPWCVKSAGKEYVANSRIPADALEILSPHLKREVLGKLIQEVQGSR